MTKEQQNYTETNCHSTGSASSTRTEVCSPPRRNVALPNREVPGCYCTPRWADPSVLLDASRVSGIRGVL